MDEDLSPVAGTSSTTAKGNCVERKCISFFYIELAEELARVKEVEWKKKNLKKIGEIGILDPFWSDLRARV